MNISLNLLSGLKGLFGTGTGAGDVDGSAAIDGAKAEFAALIANAGTVPPANDALADVKLPEAELPEAEAAADDGLVEHGANVAQAADEAAPAYDNPDVAGQIKVKSPRRPSWLPQNARADTAEIPAEPRPMPAQALKGLVKAREPFAPVARLADVRAPLTDIDDSAQDTDFDTGDGLTSADIDVPVRQEALPLGAAVTAPVIAARSNEVTSSASENSGSQDDVTIGNIPNRKNISSDKTKLVVSTSPDNAPVNAVNADAALPSGPRDTVASAGRASVPDLPRSASSNSRPVAEMPAKSGEHIMPASPEADMAEVPAIPARERATAPAAAVAAAATPVVQPELAGKPVASAASVRTSRPQQTPAMAIEPSRSGVTQPRAELPNPVAVDVEAVEPSERSDGPVKIMTPAAAPEAGRPAAKQSGIAVRDPAPAPATIKSKREAKLDFEPADLPVHAGQSIPVQPQPVEASVHEAVATGSAIVSAPSGPVPAPARQTRSGSAVTAPARAGSDATAGATTKLSEPAKPHGEDVVQPAAVMAHRDPDAASPSASNVAEAAADQTTKARPDRPADTPADTVAVTANADDGSGGPTPSVTVLGGDVRSDAERSVGDVPEPADNEVATARTVVPKTDIVTGHSFAQRGVDPNLGEMSEKTQATVAPVRNDFAPTRLKVNQDRSNASGDTQAAATAVTENSVPATPLRAVRAAAARVLRGAGAAARTEEAGKAEPRHAQDEKVEPKLMPSSVAKGEPVAAPRSATIASTAIKTDPATDSKAQPAAATASAAIPDRPAATIDAHATAAPAKALSATELLDMVARDTAVPAGKPAPRVRSVAKAATIDMPVTTPLAPAQRTMAAQHVTASATGLRAVLSGTEAAKADDQKPVERGSDVNATVAANTAQPISPPAATGVQPSAVPATPSANVGAMLDNQAAAIDTSGGWIDNIAREIATMGASKGEGSFTLNPQHLGPVRVDIRQADAGMDIRMTVTSEDAHKELSDDKQRLMTDARIASVRIADISVERATTVTAMHRTDAGNQDMSQNSGQNGSSGQQQSASSQQGLAQGSGQNGQHGGQGAAGRAAAQNLGKDLPQSAVLDGEGASDQRASPGNRRARYA